MPQIVIGPGRLVLTHKAQRVHIIVHVYEENNVTGHQFVNLAGVLNYSVRGWIYVVHRVISASLLTTAKSESLIKRATRAFVVKTLICSFKFAWKLIVI